MKIILIFILLCLFAFSVNAQKSVSDLDSIHQTVLNKWLAAKKGWRLALEKDFDQATIKRSAGGRKPATVLCCGRF